MKIIFDVYKRKIKNPNPYLVGNSRNYVKFKFIFNDEKWIGLDKYVIFKYKEKKMIKYLGNECVCEIDVPNELMEYKFIKFKIQGKDDDYEGNTYKVFGNTIRKKWIYRRCLYLWW